MSWLSWFKKGTMKQRPPAAVAVNKFLGYGLRPQLRVSICPPEDPNDPEEGFSIWIENTRYPHAMDDPIYGLLFYLDIDNELSLTVKPPDKFYGTAQEVLQQVLTPEYAALLREVLMGLVDSTKPRSGDNG